MLARDWDRSQSDYISTQLSVSLGHVTNICKDCSTTSVTKAVVCIILSGMMHINEPLLLIGKSLLSRYLSGPLPYV